MKSHLCLNTIVLIHKSQDENVQHKKNLKIHYSLDPADLDFTNYNGDFGIGALCNDIILK